MCASVAACLHTERRTLPSEGERRSDGVSESLECGEKGDYPSDLGLFMVGLSAVAPELGLASVPEAALASDLAGTLELPADLGPVLE